MTTHCHVDDISEFSICPQFKWIMALLLPLFHHAGDDTGAYTLQNRVAFQRFFSLLENVSYSARGFF